MLPFKSKTPRIRIRIRKKSKYIQIYMYKKLTTIHIRLSIVMLRNPGKSFIFTFVKHSIINFE